MMSKSERDEGQGRGLPVGWGWRPRTGAWNEGEVDLYPPGADVGEERATVYPSGKWETWEKGHSAQIMAHGTTADGAAAQAVAEAALWATDGYGTGEVRGLRLPLLDISDAAALVASRQTVALPGLSGWWIVRAARCDGGADGIEVDAVRAPGPAPLPAKWSCTLCGWSGAEPAPCVVLGQRCPACESAIGLRLHFAYAGNGEPPPLDAPPVPAAGCAKHDSATGSGIGAQNWCPGCNPTMHREAAPAAGEELARLLPGLWLDIEVASGPGRGLMPGGPEARVIEACSLLLAERAVLARGFGEILKREDRAFGLRVAYEQGRAAERARVAELEAAATRPEAQAIEATFADEQSLRNWLRANGHGADLAAGRSGAEVAIGLLARVAELEAAHHAEAAEVKGMDLGRFAYEAWAGCASEQDPSVRCLPWGDIGPDARARWCRSAIATYGRARAHMQSAAPTGASVAALLRAVEAAEKEARSNARDAALEGASSREELAHADAYREAASLIAAHLGGALSPVERVAAEVCAVADDTARLDVIGRLRSIANGARLETLAPVDPRAALKTIARVALAGMLACDAAPVPTGEEQSK